MMGVEPIEAALRDGRDVILAGRASDTALFSAYPHLHGADPGLNWHAAKTIECGAACAIPPSANGLLVHLREDHFDVETPENADPFLITEPSGDLDTTHARYDAIDERTVRVTGALYHPAPEYTVKLEGAQLAGYQTIMIGGVRDKVVIDRLPKLLPMERQYFDAKILDVFDGRVDPGTVDIDYRLYDTGAVLGPNEPTALTPSEIRVLITVTAPTTPPPTR